MRCVCKVCEMAHKKLIDVPTSQDLPMREY